mgnify:CR=1 FL=1
MPYTEEKIGYQKTDTSESAARDNVQWKMTAKQRVLQLLQKVPQSLTTEEISELLNIPYATVQPRLSELRAEGKVEDSGSRGETKWGKPCIKWNSK